ncbi:MAG TPA: DUF6062 family protein, partial [Candidatus Limiplasma sp.]|mgnify:CR=1 FL=1|nr:DUF6062 family protein [Candidatus Limiplasma sp.]HPS82031.1 DUF6062 family protein [Candidatus Limiplasma sp.]
MQYHLETIPVWEAMEWKSACPLCGLKHRTEEETVDRTLGASVMEPDARINVNRKGICAAHHAMLYARQNRLGHALLMDSHSKEQLERLRSLQKQAETAGSRKTLRLKAPAATGKLLLNLRKLTAHCVVCETVETHMTRYLATFLHLWKTNDDFHAAWLASQGVCLPHLTELLACAPSLLNDAEQNAFAAEALARLAAGLEADAKDLDWFTRKFDYRNQSEPWGNSKTALERVVNRLRGWCIGGAPAPKK